MKKYDKKFTSWLRDKNYTFKLEDWCKHCKNLKKKFTNSKNIPLHTKRTRKNLPIPAIFKNNKHLPNMYIEDLYEKYKAKPSATKRKNSFGRGINTKPSGTRRPKGDMDYIPQPGTWGAFSSTAGNNRGGNAIGCKESARWLFEDRSAPPFPIRTPPLRGYTPPRRGGGHRKSADPFGGTPLRGYTAFGRRRRPSQGDLVKTSRDSYYNARGRNGFQNVPRSIYDFDGGNVFTKSYSPYTGARISGILPRPYGNRDNASLKGYSNGRRMKTPRLSSSFGRYGPFVNQAYEPYGTPSAPRENFEDFGPFVNQAYNSSYGQRNPLYEFRPHHLRNWKPSYNSYANKDLYVNKWNPYQTYPSAKDVKKARTYRSKSKAISRASHLNFQSSGSSFGPLHSGPNRVAYEDPYLMYKNPGANTLNYLTGKQYLPPCTPLQGSGGPLRGYRVSPNKQLKVRKNNNPTGFLSNKNVVPVSGTRPPLLRSRFGASAPHNPWVAKGKQMQRPYNTQFVSGGDETASSGYTRIGQPLELYAYQNTDYGSYKYPEFLGQRAWMGGYGQSKKKSMTKTKTKRRKKTKTKTPRRVLPRSVKRTRRKAGPGDTLVVKNGKIKIKGNKKKGSK